MKRILFLLALMLAQNLQALTDREIEEIAVESYIFGYPLVTIEMTRRIMTNVVEPTDNKAPMGQFFHLRSYPDPDFKEVTTPNADTLYSIAWIDLAKEPYILHVPAEHDRYYLMPMLDAWTNVFGSPGTRTTGTSEQDFIITGPEWNGQSPPGLIEYKSLTNLVWIIGRTYCTGTSEDYRAVHALQKQYTLTPLSFYNKLYIPPSGTINHSLDMKKPVRTQVNTLSAIDFFNILADSMKSNAPTPQDAPMVAKMAKIGLIPGSPFTADTKMKALLEPVPFVAIEKIASHEKDGMKESNGWKYLLNTGIYGTNYIQRAFVAMVGLGANLPEDAVYYFAKTDAAGKILNGTNPYHLTFAKEKIPPAKGFWSLTLYDTALFFFANSLDRYALSPSRNALNYFPNGDLTFWIQNRNPGKDKEPNWLPAPPDGFILTLRCYWPDATILKGTWTPSALEK